MADKLNCVFCNNTSGNVILFAEEILRKCNTILKLRKEHNLKYKDIILPVEVADNGYHRQCYKSFMGLMKKYYATKSTTAEESIWTNKPTSTITERSSTAASLIPESTTQLVKPQASSSLENVDVFEFVNVSENLDLTSELNIPSQGDEITEDNSIVCLFCNQKKKKHRSAFQPLHETDKEKFKSSIIQILTDREEYQELFNRLANINGTKIYYHNICKLDFNNKITLFSNKYIGSTWHGHRKYHQIVFDEVSTFIRKNVIEKGRCYFLSYLHRYYVDLLEKVSVEHSDKIDVTFTPQHLEDKIIKILSQQIKFFTTHNKKVIAPNHLRAIDDEVFENLKDEDILQRAALLLRNSILEIKKKPLPDIISTQHLIDGEASVPQKLLDFYYTMLGGCSRKRKNSAKCARQVHSYSEDIVYAVHNGKIKTSKHIMLGILLKSLTSSRKVIDIINRYGHCISYQGIEELETESTYTSIAKSSLCPENIKKTPDLCTGVAYDNFDRFVETRNGKDTLHDTVGIIYQNIDLSTIDISEISDTPTADDDETSKKKKEGGPLRPYLQK